jgi:Coenzyme PQQ synthesis protein D (PqqD)
MRADESRGLLRCQPDVEETPVAGRGTTRNASYLDSGPGSKYTAQSTVEQRKGRGHMPTEDQVNPADAAGVAETTMISRSPSVLTAEVDGEIVMMSIERGRYFGLDDIGGDIWKRLEGPCSFGQLIDRLVVDYDADRATIAADVRALLGRMVEQDVVRLA